MLVLGFFGFFFYVPVHILLFAHGNLALGGRLLSIVYLNSFMNSILTPLEGIEEEVDNSNFMSACRHTKK